MMVILLHKFYQLWVRTWKDFFFTFPFLTAFYFIFALTSLSLSTLQSISSQKIGQYIITGHIQLPTLQPQKLLFPPFFFFVLCSVTTLWGKSDKLFTIAGVSLTIKSHENACEGTRTLTRAHWQKITMMNDWKKPLMFHRSCSFQESPSLWAAKEEEDDGASNDVSLSAESSRKPSARRLKFAARSTGSPRFFQRFIQGVLFSFVSRVCC